MMLQNTHTNSPRPHVCTWRISTPLEFVNGELKNRPTPGSFDLFFFGWHNALTTLRMRAKEGLIFVFNITLIIIHLKRAFNALYILGRIPGEESRTIPGEESRPYPAPQPEPRPSNKTLMLLTSACTAPGTKNSTRPNKRSNHNRINNVL